MRACDCRVVNMLNATQSPDYGINYCRVHRAAFDLRDDLIAMVDCFGGKRGDFRRTSSEILSAVTTRLADLEAPACYLVGCHTVGSHDHVSAGAVQEKRGRDGETWHECALALCVTVELLDGLIVLAYDSLYACVLAYGDQMEPEVRQARNTLVRCLKEVSKGIYGKT